MSTPKAEPTPRGDQGWPKALTLIALTFLSTCYVGAFMVSEGASSTLAPPFDWLPWPENFLGGWVFSVPLMGILLAHEFGHYLVGRHHGVDISPPYFIPAPIFLLGTMGAVIRMRGRIDDRNALLDVGAAGPLAGMVVALPVLIYGIASSPIEPLPEGNYIIEGRSILYMALLWVLKGPIAEGHDIFLTPTALAGWAGLLVTMINLLPVGQLDGGHIAYALFGLRQDAFSEQIRRALPFLAVLVSVLFAAEAYLEGARGDALWGELAAGMHWMVWAAVLWVMTRMAGPRHPPTGLAPLSPGRRLVARGTLLLFVLLFMPSWIRTV